MLISAIAPVLMLRPGDLQQTKKRPPQPILPEAVAKMQTRQGRISQSSDCLQTREKHVDFPVRQASVEHGVNGPAPNCVPSDFTIHLLQHASFFSKIRAQKTDSPPASDRLDVSPNATVRGGDATDSMALLADPEGAATGP